MSEQMLEVKQLLDYQPSPYELTSVDLVFRLHPTATRVMSTLNVVRGDNVDVAEPLILMGESLNLLSVVMDGQVLTANDYQLTDSQLVLSAPEERVCQVQIEVEINPKANSQLEGLYLSDGVFCTQCEAEGFRRITYFLDRPDVMTRYRVRIEAEKNVAPVLLSNGNLIAQGDLTEGWHYALWEDPFPKPSYLFALVAGDLVCRQQDYVTAEGKSVSLEVYVKAHHANRCEHALLSLAKAMRWDEQQFGRCYDLERYMIVAVDDFNMGAMENKGLNVFNARFVLADARTATDTDYINIDSVIAHEYFHNWTGNRVTCRNWFQLTLKEGLTVFRDQLYTEQTLLGKVKRIEDVRTLRSVQFAEDASPMRHPIQPQSYVEMNNFYTATVYEKGAEVVRIYQTLLGVDGFRKGMDLYFSRHDGQAVTVHEFRQAMADANGVNLDQMHHWYVQAGTPQLKVSVDWQSATGQLALTFTQCLNGQLPDLPLLIPMSMAIFTESGQRQRVQLQQGEGRWRDSDGVIWLTKPEQTVVFAQVTERPYLSLLRDFSAPVTLVMERQLSDWLWQAKHDDDLFNRWEAWQQMWVELILAALEQQRAQQPISFPAEMIPVVRQLFADETLEPNWLSEVLRLPSFDYLAQQLTTLWVDELLGALRALKRWLAEQLLAEMTLKVRQLSSCDTDGRYDALVMGQRALRNRLLDYLSELRLAWVFDWAAEQVKQAVNMTNAQAALTLLVHQQAPQADQALADFMMHFQDVSLVVDKWFSVQATSPALSATAVDNLCHHRAFVWTNPNRVRSVLGSWGRANPSVFHQADGEGYRLLAERIVEMDAINPQVAARLLQSFNHWRKLPQARRALAEKALLRLSLVDRLSRDSREVLSHLIGKV